MSIPRTTLRIGNDSLSFAVATPSQQPNIQFDAYPLRAGISMAANLREAFASHSLISDEGGQAQVLIDSPIMLAPIEEADTDIETLFHHTFTGFEGCLVLQSILPDLNSIAVFAINKDVKMVISNHFDDVRYMPAIQPVLSYLHRRSGSLSTASRGLSTTAQLYAYNHGNRLHVFSYQRNRLRFYNSFDNAHTSDAAYYILYIWKQLAFNPLTDELYLCGDIEDKLTETLRQYLQNAHVITPAAEFNRAPITQIAGMPFDLMTLFVKGR